MQVDYSIYLVAQTNACEPGRFFEVVEAALQGGVTLVQLREKNAETGAFVKTALKLKKLLKLYNVPLIINDRIDVALACDAEGVHLGQSDMPLPLARKILGPDKIIGISASNVDEAMVAEQGGADYIGAGAVYDTPTKTDTGMALGLNGLKAITEAVKIPVVAVGGMKAHNALAMRQHGAAGVAVVSAIMAALDPEAAATEFKQAFGGQNPL